MLLCSLPRLLTVLLPAYSRHYSTLKGAGLLTTSDDAENQQLEHLVLRERGVVWADQEKAEQQRGAESHAEGFRLAPILTFSHLAGHLNSPCSELPQLSLSLLYIHPSLRFDDIPPVGLTTWHDPGAGKPSSMAMILSISWGTLHLSSCHTTGLALIA